MMPRDRNFEFVKMECGKVTLFWESKEALRTIFVASSGLKTWMREDASSLQYVHLAMPHELHLKICAAVRETWVEKKIFALLSKFEMDMMEYY